MNFGSLLTFERWNLIVMLCLFAALFVFEMLGIFHKEYVTITEIIRATIPKWARWMVLGWLIYHFGVE